MLDGRVIRDLFYSPEGQDGTSFAFNVHFLGLPGVDAMYACRRRRR